VQGLDDLTKEPLIQRPDDNLETAKTRIQLFHDQTEPIISYYRKKGLVAEVDADRAIDTV